MNKTREMGKAVGISDCFLTTPSDSPHFLPIMKPQRKTPEDREIPIRFLRGFHRDPHFETFFPLLPFHLPKAVRSRGKIYGKGPCDGHKTILAHTGGISHGLVAPGHNPELPTFPYTFTGTPKGFGILQGSSRGRCGELWKLLMDGPFHIPNSRALEEQWVEQEENCKSYDFP